MSNGFSDFITFLESSWTTLAELIVTITPIGVALGYLIRPRIRIWFAKEFGPRRSFSDESVAGEQFQSPEPRVCALYVCVRNMPWRLVGPAESVQATANDRDPAGTGDYRSLIEIYLQNREKVFDASTIGKVIQATDPPDPLVEGEVGLRGPTSHRLFTKGKIARFLIARSADGGQGWHLENVGQPVDVPFEKPHDIWLRVTVVYGRRPPDARQLRIRFHSWDQPVVERNYRKPWVGWKSKWVSESVEEFPGE